MWKAKLTIRRKIKLYMTVCAVAVMMCSVIPVSAASREYEVTFRVGSKGAFVGTEGTSIKENYACDSSINDLPEVIAESGYYQTGWSPELTEGTIVTKRQVYVAQYARITDAADYRVNYVDTEGMPIATQKVASTQKGTEVKEQAPAIDGYTPDAQAKTAAINDSGTEITFIYTAGQNVVTETETQTETTIVPGTTTTATTPGAATGTDGAATTEGGTGTVAGSTATTAGGTGTAAGSTGTTADGTATTADGVGTTTTTAAEGEETTTISDDNVPLAENPAGDGEATETLEDEEVPKADKDLDIMSPWVYAGIAAAVLALAGIMILIIRKKKKN